MKFEKPIIVVSKCLEFERCRYDWQVIRNNLISKLEKHVDFIKVCPEMSIWLPSPRLPIRLMNKSKKLVLEEIKTENDYTEDMQEFSTSWLDNLTEVDWFILKSKSPSCGLSWVKVHNWTIWLEKIKNLHSGLFAKEVINKFPLTPKEEEWRLLNFKIREDYLSKIFCLAELRKTLTLDHKALTDFQAKHKFLFMSFSPVKQNEAWNILGKKEDWYKEAYFVKVHETLNTYRRKDRFVNTCEHIMWFFKNELTSNEKAYFLWLLSDYKKWNAPMIMILALLKNFAIRHWNEYILNQSFLYPYPEELFELSDSNKKIEF